MKDERGRMNVVLAPDGKDEGGMWKHRVFSGSCQPLYEAGMVQKGVIEKLTAEADELISVFVTIVRRLKANTG